MALTAAETHTNAHAPTGQVPGNGSSPTPFGTPGVDEDGEAASPPSNINLSWASEVPGGAHGASRGNVWKCNTRSTLVNLASVSPSMRLIKCSDMTKLAAQLAARPANAAGRDSRVNHTAMDTTNITDAPMDSRRMPSHRTVAWYAFMHEDCQGWGAGEHGTRNNERQARPRTLTSTRPSAVVMKRGTASNARMVAAPCSDSAKMLWMGDLVMESRRCSSRREYRAC